MSLRSESSRAGRYNIIKKTHANKTKQEIHTAGKKQNKSLNNNTMLSLWTATFGTMYQLALLVWGIVRFQSFISFCRGANSSGRHEFVKNALLLSLFSYAPLVAISVTFMWVSYDKEWQAGVVFVVLPVLSLLFFALFLLGTVNDITHQIDVSRRGRKRLPQQPPPQLIVAPVSANDLSSANIGGVLTPPRVLQMPNEGSGYRNGGGGQPVLPMQQDTPHFVR